MIDTCVFIVYLSNAMICFRVNSFTKLPFFQGVQLGIFFERGNTWGDELIHLEYTP